MRKKSYLISLVCFVGLICMISYIHINIKSVSQPSAVSMQTVEGNTENLLPETKFIKTLIIKASEIIQSTSGL